MKPRHHFVYFTAVAVLLFVLGLELVGIRYEWFQQFFWYDTTLHLLAGASIGLVGSEYVRRMAQKYVTPHEWGILVFVLLIGIAWELFEIMTNNTGYVLWTLSYYVDTFKDMIMDVGGAIAALLAVRKW